MTQTTDTENTDLKSSIDANNKAISDLKDSINSLREEVRRGFKKLDGKLDTLDERTKLGFWGFILRGLVLAILIGVGGYLLPIIAQYVDKLPSL